MSLLIRRPSAPISEDLLDQVEEHFQVKLPDEYRAFLLATNGGLPVNDQFTYRGKSGDKHATLLHLYGVGRDGQVDGGTLELVSANIERPSGLREGCLFVGEGETAMNYGKVVLACAGDDAGKVFYRPDVEDDKPTLYPVAESFPAFLGSLKHEGKKGAKPWRLAIYQGDLDALKEAMNGPKRVRISDAAELAVEDGQWEILKYLMSVAKKNDDLTPAWVFAEALRQDRFGLVKSVLSEFDVPRKYLAECLAGTDGFLWLDTDLACLLIEKGADVNTDPDAGASPLHCAVTSTNADAVALLIEKGADPTATNDDGRTPRELANRLEETKIAQMLKDYEAEWAKRQPAAAGPQAKPFDLRGITFTRVGKPITLEEIVAFEKKMNLTFPPEYRWLLLQANGAILSANLIPNISMEDDADEDFDDDDFKGDDFEDEDEDLQEEEYDGGDEGYVRVTLFPLRKDDCPDEFPEDEDPPPSLHQSAEEAAEWYHDGSEIPKGMLPIAELHGYGYEGAGYLLIGCNRKSLGQLFGFDHSKQSLGMTLPELFAKLAEVASRPKPAVDRLADAIAARDIDGVKAALAEDKMPFCARDGRMPIRMMFEAKYDEAIRAYLESGADLSPVMSDAVNFDRTDIIKECLRRMKKVRKDDLNMLQFIPGVYRDAELLKLLHDKGLKFNKTGRHDIPLAHVAAASNSLAALQFAIDQKADLHAVEKHSGRTTLIAACDSHYGDPVAMVTRLLELGVKPGHWTCEGRTALHFAVSHGHVEAAKKLIDAGESMFKKYECYAEGMSVEETRKMMQRSMKQAEKMFEELGKDMEDEDDMPPPADTSTPEGEKAAELMELMGKARENMGGLMENLMGKMQEQRDEGFVGQPANAQTHYRDPDAAAKAIPILEAYERAKRGA